MIRAIIFDCFGVLVADVYRQRINEFVHTHPEQDKALHDILKAVDRKMITEEESAQHLGEIMGVSTEELLMASTKGEVRNDALMDFVTSLRPRYKLALLSNIRGRDSLDRRFKPGELDEVFDVVVPSGDVGFIKPEHQIYEITAQKLGVLPEECVMIDDVAEYCEGARAVGMQAIHFVSNDQAIHDLHTLIDTQAQKD